MMSNNNKILALKYRPQSFKDLIGQEIAAEIILNGIQQNKTPNAYLLTGIRGVGKTTTARLIAKALNCNNDFTKNIQCPKGTYCHCLEIAASNHMDVIEIDAASKTGIDDVREIIENAKYSPTSGKYKIFIIDEVHMLSKQAFNGLLKTLEEPPSRLKFVLATTEVRKIPITILSRCQRLDLKRVSIENISKHLKKILEIEKILLSESIINIISMQSEGSVRDAVSLLDRVILFTKLRETKGELKEEEVIKILGINNKTEVIKLLNIILQGKTKEAVSVINQFLNNGVDARNILNDLLEVIYLFSRGVVFGIPTKDRSLTETEIKLINESVKNIQIEDLNLFWHLTIKAIENLNFSNNEKINLEMYIIEMTHVRGLSAEQKISTDLTDKQNLAPIENNIRSSSQMNPENKFKDQLKSLNQEEIDMDNKPINQVNVLTNNKLEIKSFQDLINIAKSNNEFDLLFDLERNVNLIAFEQNKIEISFNPKLSKNFIKHLANKLYEWTNTRWIISLSQKEGLKSIYDQKIIDKQNTIKDLKNADEVKKILKTFDQIELTDIKNIDKNND